MTRCYHLNGVNSAYYGDDANDKPACKQRNYNCALSTRHLEFENHRNWNQDDEEVTGGIDDTSSYQMCANVNTMFRFERQRPLIRDRSIDGLAILAFLGSKWLENTYVHWKIRVSV